MNHCLRYDCLYDENGHWIEPPCSSKEHCEFCTDRPEKHPEVCTCELPDFTKPTKYHSAATQQRDATIIEDLKAIIRSYS